MTIEGDSFSFAALSTLRHFLTSNVVPSFYRVKLVFPLVSLPEVLPCFIGL